MENQELLVKMIFDRWTALLKNCDAKLQTISDEQLAKEIVLGKNRGIYLLGHLIATHDAMVHILNVDEQHYKDLFEQFVNKPDDASVQISTAQELRAIWKLQLETLPSKLERLSVDEWFGKHNSVSEEDFIKEPHRNKLNILLTRTTHLSYHVGQIALIQ